jgi:hypothetical protein
MSIVMTQNGDKATLNAASAASAYWRVRLFKNDYTPLVTSVLGDFTEADFTGYSGFQVAVWLAAVINGAGKGIIVASPLLWTAGVIGTGNTIYGYYVTEGTDALVSYAERFASPVVIANVGDFVVVTPSVTAVTE